MKFGAVFQAALRDEWDGLERITRDVRPADLVTLANALTGLAAIIMAASGQIHVATILIFVGVILDGLDGAVARMGYGGGPLGGFLDSLADAITFAVAPATIIVVGLSGTPYWITFTVAAFYVSCAIMRLARFEALRERPTRRYFSGMSTPGAATAVLAMYHTGPAGLVLALTVFSGIVMVSRVRYPKLRGALGASTVTILITVMATWNIDPWHMWSLYVMIGFMTAYLVAGPYYVLARIGPTPDPRALGAPPKEQT